MTDPTRMSELGPDDLRARLLRSAAPDAPADGAHARAAVALGLGAPIGAGGAAVAHSASKSLVALIAKWLGIGALAGVVTSGVASKTYDVWMSSKPAPTNARVSAQPNPPATAPARELALPAQPEVALPPPPNATVASSATRTPNATSAAASGENAPADSLADELARVDKARAALASGNAAGALSALDQYRAAYPRARLADESTALRIEALLAQGRRAEAVALADRFLSEHPKSALSQRVRTLVGR